MKCFYLTVIFFIAVITLLNSNNINYEKLKEIEEKLLDNKETYLELIKIEKEIQRDLNKANINIKKYNRLVKKGFSEKKILESIIANKENELKKVITKKSFLKNSQSLLLNNILVSQYEETYTKVKSSIIKVIIEEINTQNNYNDTMLINLEKDIKKYSLSLKNLDTSLNNIELALNNRSIDLEALIGETIITEIEKQENIIQKNKIIKKANKIRSLIEDFENNVGSNEIFGDFNFTALKDILPIKVINIKNIKTARLKTGIRLSVINATNLLSPKNSLVVYADYFKGYGNMIILDLSNEYHLILSGISNIKCKTGDWLEKGMVLGDINNNNNNKFYMEFRHKGKTINPSKWAKLN